MSQRTHPWPAGLVDPTSQRDPKPRRTGLTMVIDKGLGLTQFQDVLALANEYIDFIKLGFGTSVLYPEIILKEKLALAKEYGVTLYPGGTFFEVAFVQDRVSSYLEHIVKRGFKTVEISDGSTDIPLKDRYNAIKLARSMGLKVITECGKKTTGSVLQFQDMRKTVLSDLEHGAEYVIVEGRESGENVGIYDEKGETDPYLLQNTVHDVAGYRDALIWEAPKKAQQVTLIEELGPQVNVGNIQPQDILALETLRRGLRSDTFFLHEFKTSILEEKA
ncbi:phosphosulfolactate synthase [Caldalkalibacillus salinus]|uniref:phosphosulfolactate synthase n=1 Tax=Caldalkalibacillus salinus TaxID=2803787 RepID=UPI00192416D6|nr:phosphosulfolactate synthase [Caldalkalibacillus salinus]